MKLLLLVALLGALQVKDSTQESQKSLKISLYYETLCPGCRWFISKQLYPTYQKIGSHLEVNLVPYGNTQRTKDENGKWVYDCQHGPEECAINKIEACGLAKSNKQDKQVEFVYCIESLVQQDNNDYEKLANCASHLGLKGSEILKCSQGPEGDELFGKLADKQPADLDGVPWVTINNEHADYESLQNFLKAACDKLSNKPKGCQNQ